ncbi:hypothetical protein PWT90_00720 [Aphanocladium album]|nr:hypothetical protein PWT90_00720 [Aphanocladium album]
MDDYRNSWAGVRDPVERRKIQNRLNKRAERNRKSSQASLASASPSISATEADSLLRSSRVNTYGNGGLPQTLVLRQPLPATQEEAGVTELRKPELPQPLGKRKWAPKVRTGCLTCNSLQGLCQDANSLDKEAFHAMRSFVFIDVAGAYDKNFWIVDAVRAAQTYSAVWHAGLALTEMYRSRLYENAGLSRRRSSHIRAMEQYGRAVRSILDVMSQPDISLADKKAVLFSSILLIGFCCLGDDKGILLAHIRNAFQIFNNWQIWESISESSTSSGIISVGSLIKQFERFEVQCVTVQLPGVSLDSKVRVRPCSSSFESAADAYTEFLHLSLPFLTAMRDIGHAAISGEPIPENAVFCRLLFIEWKAKFAALLQAGRVEVADEECILSLQIWSITIEISLFIQRVGGAESDLHYDAWSPSFEKQLDLAEQLYSVVTKSMTIRQPVHLLQPFAFTATATDALALVARCRIGSTRRRAVALLRKWPYRDGVGSTSLVAAIIEAKMNLEEGFLLHGQDRPKGCECIVGQFICALHRCITHRLDRLGPERGVLRVTLPSDSRNPQDVVERTLEISW